MPTPASPRRRRLPLAALALVAAVMAFAAGVVHLFTLRFSLGDVYPPYSTLRTDPLGTKALFEALAAQPGLSVERNLRPLNLLGKSPFGAVARGPNADADASLACFYLGADAYGWPFFMDTAAVDRLETVLRAGGRVVVTFLPISAPLTVGHLNLARREAGFPSASPKPRNGHSSSSPSPTPTATPKPRRAAAELPPDLIARWKIDFQRGAAHGKSGSTHPASSPAAAGEDHDRALPVVASDGPPVPWHSAAAFDLDADPARAAGWTTWYARDGQPVIVARPFGNRGGKLILASDSYFLSNEGLRAEPRPGLLAALIGPCRRLIFDENHLGISEHPGLMTLARRYRLQGALAALALLAALFVWKNASSLVPPSSAEGATPPTVPGRDSAAGFLNLLRRAVPARDLPAACLAQWEDIQSWVGGESSPQAAARERLRAVVQEDAARPARQRSPAAAYRAMCAALHGGRRPKGVVSGKL